MSELRHRLGCLLLYGRSTPPPSITMCNGQVQVWIRDDQAEAFRRFDVIRRALASYFADDPPDKTSFSSATTDGREA